MDSLNSFSPMEVTAAADEVARLVAAHPGRPFLVFPEDRRNPIRMFDQLPLRGTDRGPGGELVLGGRRGEFVAFQLGVYAVTKLDQLTVTVSALMGTAGRIAAERATVLNTGGTGWDGKPFTSRVDVPAGRVQAMWGGIQVSEATAPGE